MIPLPLRAQVAEACRALRRDGLTVGTAGNVSVRRGDLVAVSPSGLDYDEMTAKLVGVHEMDGTPVDAPLEPTSELGLHLGVYARSDAGAIVHWHAPASTALSCVVTAVPASHYYTMLFGGIVRVAPYATYGSPELAANVAEARDGRSGALMANHGAVATAPTLAAALQLAHYLEYLCDLHLRALSTGLPIRTLDGAELAAVAEKIAGYGPRSR